MTADEKRVEPFTLPNEDEARRAAVAVACCSDDPYGACSTCIANLLASQRARLVEEHEKDLAEHRRLARIHEEMDGAKLDAAERLAKSACKFVDLWYEFADTLGPLEAAQAIGEQMDRELEPAATAFLAFRAAGREKEKE